MRAFLVALIAAPALASAQGSIILSRPCFPCPADAVCRPCGQVGAQVVKQSSQVRALLSDRVLRYEVTETFVNRGARVGEADYVFPLPRGAAFQDLQLSINGEMVAGETLNASQARSIYEDIVRRQRDPALVEWMGYGMLRARIFPINPGEEKKVVVRYQMVAEREGDALRVDYFRGREQQNDQWRVIPASRRDEPRSSFVLAYPANSSYGRPYSPTHALTTNERGGRREVTVDGNGSEITVLIPVRKSTEPSLSMLAYAPRNEDGFALITLSPPAIATRTTPRDVTLVLDVSGSMAGVKIQQARDAGKQVLATLTSSDRFRLIDFSTDVRSFRDGFVRATPQNIADASQYLESLDASGSTNISGALDEALQGDVPSGRLGLVLFVTDGAPTVGERDPEAIAQRAARERGDRRIFTFGVGADLNASLIERLALEGRGTAQFVRREESVERAVSIVASRLTNPVVTNVRIYADGVRLVKPYPSGPSDIFAGQDFVMLARYKGNGSGRVRVEGETPNGPVRWTSPVNFPETARENPFVARLWATQRVGYLSAEKRRSGGSSEIDDEIRELGEKYAIPTEFTSYLVVEPSMRRALDAATNMTVGGIAQAPPPVAQKSGTARGFEAVREAAKLRAATSLAAADEVSILKPEAVQHVGARTFNLKDGVWTDVAVRKSTRVVKVRAFSKAYFSLVNEIPDLKDALALGDKVAIAGRDVVIEIADDGVEAVSDGDLKRIVAAW